MHSILEGVFLDLMEEYLPFIATKQDKQHFRKWCRAYAPVVVSRMIDHMGKPEGTQKEEANAGGTEGQPVGGRASAGSSKRRTAGSKRTGSAGGDTTV